MLALTPEIEAAWDEAIRGLARSASRARKSLPHRVGFDPAVLSGNLGVAGWGSLEAMLGELRRQTQDAIEETMLSRLLDDEAARAAPAAR